jgi:hypothetical protein
VWLPAPCEWLDPPWESELPLSLLLLLDFLLSEDDELEESPESDLSELFDELPFDDDLAEPEPDP